MISHISSSLLRRTHLWSYQILIPRKLIAKTVKHVANSAKMQPRFSSGTDEDQSLTEVNALLERKWMLDEDSMGIQKTFNFPTFAKALVNAFSQPASLTLTKRQDFILLVGIECKLKNHHPELRNVSQILPSIIC